VGQKVHPFGFRLGFNKTWRSRWYSDRDYAKLLHEDLALRSTLKKRFAHAGVSKIETERAGVGFGTPEQIVERLSALKALGLGYTIAYFAESAYDTSGMHLFENEVISELR